MTRTRERPPDIDFDELQGADPRDLTEDERRFLQDRAILPKGAQSVPVVFYLPDGTPISNDPAYFTAAAQQLSDHVDEEEFNRRVEERAQAIAAEMVKAEMASHQAVGGEYHGNAVNQPPKGGTPTKASNAAQEEEEDYSTYNTQELEAELSRRNLNIHGKKVDKIARLERDDRDELEDDDRA